MIQALDVDLNIAPRLVHLVEQGHLILHYVDDLVDVPTMRVDQLLLLLKDLLNELLVVCAQLVHTLTVLSLKLRLGLDMSVE